MMYSYGPVMLPPVLQPLRTEPVQLHPVSLHPSLDSRNMLARRTNRNRKRSPPKKEIIRLPPKTPEYIHPYQERRSVSPTTLSENSNSVGECLSPTLSEQHSSSGDVCLYCGDVVPEVNWIFVGCVGGSACAECCKPNGNCPFCDTRCGENEALLRANAEKKEPNCCFELGQRYLDKGNTQLAATYLERAASLGHTEAAFRLGFFS
mmetsp:Transcript_1077/g.1555  ORF Transcript_1077/g.1555 Transcript_1077/m.1555 type:complete len:206 (+) Transcript_1077:188-805(+)